jgi:COMPASS component SWD1
MTPEEVEKPLWVFQDVVSKVKFASCDISGDAEFVVGGANGNDNKYELYIWNTSTGALMDKLTGAPVEVYSVSWHPTRSFLAVATSDGLIDMWGPRINWTAFAPDFQALPSNVEYVEREDEFDNDEEENGDEPKNEEDEEEIVSVDVVTVDPVPVFASDSEDEEEVFCFETKITRRIGTFTA